MGDAGITDVDARLSTGSVIVNYGETQSKRHDVVRLLGDAGVDLAEGLAGVAGDGGEGDTETELMDAAEDASAVVSEVTGLNIDLRIFLPVTLGALGALKVARDGLSFADVPAYILLWYAFDTFWKLNHEHHHTDAQRTSGAGSRPDATG